MGKGTLLWHAHFEHLEDRRDTASLKALEGSDE
jgi:hypothetical protein